MSRVTSQAGIDLIKSFEGFTGTAFRLQVGTDANANAIYDSQNYTYGYGHCAPEVKAGQTITKAEAEELLRKDIKQFEDDVNNTEFVPVTNSLNQNQFDALVSFRYNCGGGGLKYLCQGKTVAQIGEALPNTYISSNGVRLQGLVNRRLKEQALFNCSSVDTSGTGAEIKFSQEVLDWQKTMNIGFDYEKTHLVEDGLFGTACEAFAMTHNLYKGITENYNCPTAVRWLQIKIETYADGIFGRETYVNLLMYQKAHNLYPDGICGIKTYKSILNV